MSCSCPEKYQSDNGVCVIKEESIQEPVKREDDTLACPKNYKWATNLKNKWVCIPKSNEFRVPCTSSASAPAAENPVNNAKTVANLTQIAMDALNAVNAITTAAAMNNITTDDIN